MNATKKAVAPGKTVNTEEDVRRALIDDRRDRLLAVLRAEATGDELDVGAFRRDHETDYRRLGRYFGGVREALRAAGLRKVGERPSVTQRLAYDFLTELRKTTTLEEIGRRYGVTRMAVCKLLRKLRAAVAAEEEGEELVDTEAD